LPWRTLARVLASWNGDVKPYGREPYRTVATSELHTYPIIRVVMPMAETRIVVPYDVAREAQRRANLIANGYLIDPPVRTDDRNLT